jgi:hypothetical protein
MTARIEAPFPGGVAILYDSHGCESGGTVDAVDSKSTAARHGGSNPPSRTMRSDVRRPHCSSFRTSYEVMAMLSHR